MLIAIISCFGPLIGSGVLKVLKPFPLLDLPSAVDDILVGAKFV